VGSEDVLTIVKIKMGEDHVKILKLAALSVCLTVASAASAWAQDPIAVRIGWLRASLTTIIQPIAEQEGLYAKRGVAARITAVTSGNNATGIESLLRGDYDIYFGAMSELARLNAVALEQGGRPPLVAVAIGTPGATHLVVRNDMPFKDVEDLRGKTLGVSSLGSIHVVMFRHYLASRGLTTERLGLRLLRVAGGDMTPALLTKQIDGFLHSQPTPSIAVLAGAGRIALTPKEMGEVGRSPTSAIMARRDWAARNPEAVRRVVETFRDASALFSTMPRERLIQIAQNATGGDPRELEASLPSIDPRLVDDFQEGAEIYWRTEITAMKTRGEVIEKFSPSDMFDFSYAAKR
jgi:ABC-type nitrate/sulfonate/bicarbonate transport system substrate-binding protein